MRILAFDVGIKNLSYCLIDDTEIKKWDIINLIDDNVLVKKVDLQTICKRLFICLKDLFKDEEMNYVMIENQPVMKNPTMKSIQMMIFSFFQYMKDVELKDIKKVEFISARSKVILAEKILKSKNIEADICSKKYTYNKKIAIKCVNELVKESENAEFFSSHKKKDDLADCYLLSIVKLLKEIPELTERF